MTFHQSCKLWYVYFIIFSFYSIQKTQNTRFFYLILLNTQEIYFIFVIMFKFLICLKPLIGQSRVGERCWFEDFLRILCCPLFSSLCTFLYCLITFHFSLSCGWHCTQTTAQDHLCHLINGASRATQIFWRQCKLQDLLSIF